ncbi:alpha,alpha-trehalose-phosphate synthase (UDP-forming) [Zavarzinia sp. CC-PAN008]|uniref:alpha,alpha-trehalose-phosphate synthase (UDP-forming) n=1 Tax=Zavarzinia sp. CC-PAN008 TaxID=3243332 RepID=UPI003F74900B
MAAIVVSNRVARPSPDAPVMGGLAAALLPAVQNNGAIWFGGSGDTVASVPDTLQAKVEPLGAGLLATVDLPTADYQRFYEGFANGALWPVLHSRPDLIQVAQEDFGAYCRINAMMAQALVPLVKADVPVWIHDYHFMTLGLDLRRRGIDNRLGFFFHTPFPAPDQMATLPHHRELLRAMLSYDLIGFQTEDDRRNFIALARSSLDVGERDGCDLVLGGHVTRLSTNPIGIDTDGFAAQAARAASLPEVSRLRNSLGGAKLAIGVDRMDYSKGIANRFRAFARYLEQHPEPPKAAALLQIALPTRERIDAYRSLRNELSGLAGEINGRFAEVDWSPIRYLNRGFSQSVLAGFYRVAEVGCVTPIRDGMNLVAKEYVAAQNPLDPGVLVLSRFAGAARQLDAALMVNPLDAEDVAGALHRAFAMPAPERRERWAAMMDVMRASSLDDWFNGFLADLAARPRRTLSVRAAQRRQLAPAAA